MSVIFLLIPLSLFIAAGFLGAFIWAVRSGQYEDTMTPALRVLLENPASDPATARPASPNAAEITSAPASAGLSAPAAVASGVVNRISDAAGQIEEERTVAVPARFSTQTHCSRHER